MSKFLYVNGDSYSVVSTGRRYADFLSEYLECPVQNSAIPGSCNSRILRTSFRDLLKIRKKYDDVVAVISLSYTIRSEVWDESLIGKNRFINDGEFTSITLTSQKRWLRDKLSIDDGPYKNFIEQKLRWFNIEAETTNLLKDVLLLVSWLEKNNIKYVFFSGPLQEPIDFESPFVKPFYDELDKNPNVINFFQNSFTKWCVDRGHEPINDYTQEIHGKTYKVGHQGEAAHADFSKYLFDNYLKDA